MNPKDGKTGLNRNQVRQNPSLNAITFTLCFPFGGIQILATLCVCLTTVRHGSNIALTSGVIFSFQKNRDDDIKITMEEASWLRKGESIL